MCGCADVRTCGCADVWSWPRLPSLPMLDSDALFLRVTTMHRRLIPGLLCLTIAGCAMQPASPPTPTGTAATPAPTAASPIAPADSSDAGSTQAVARTQDETEYGKEGKKKDGTVVYCR